MMHFEPEYQIIRQQMENRLSVIRRSFYRDARAINKWETVVAGTACGVEPPPESGWVPFQTGGRWGGSDTTQWFRATVEVPDTWQSERVFAVLTPGNEALCYVDGVPRQGLDHHRSHVLLRESATGGEKIPLLIDAYAKGEQVFGVAQICVQDTDAWNLYYDVRVALDVVLAHPPESDIGRRLFDVCYETLKHVDPNTIDDLRVYHEQIERASQYFGTHIDEFRHSYNDGEFTVFGQSHIDVAWLWPIRVTQKKIGRTFSTALQYMEQYPEFTCIMSQPQLYEYIKNDYPEIWERLKEKVKSGQWEVSGAPWVEQDLNVPSGESHVRQYLYGNRFYRKEFGVHSRLVWIPDCFGYTFSLPQIMKKAQIDYFYTTKLHGNEYNRHPYDLFRWRGIDGTEILAIQTPNKCNDEPTPERLKFSWRMFRQKSIAETMPFAFGFGDGGGGPTIDHIEYALRLSNISGVPRLTWGKAEETYDRIVETTDWSQIPIYHDEMYYERHRGCQTSQARTKRNNRKAELLARDTEFFSSLAFIEGSEYRHDDINNAWKLILLNQFHDILPGSSIQEVYVDAERDYETAFSLLDDVRDESMRILNGSGASSDQKTIIVRNTLGWTRTDVAVLECAELSATPVHIIDADGNVVSSQRVKSLDGNDQLLFEVNDVPSFGYAVFRLVEGDQPSKTTGPKAPKATTKKLENDYFEVGFSNDGSIARLWDKRNNRSVLSANAKGNELALFEDHPASSDAWDVNFNVFEVSEEYELDGTITVVENGPVRATVRVVRRSANSVVTQDISLWCTIQRIDFVTRIDWQEKHRLLKASFPVDVTSRRATYEIQYGAIERPTHRSTQWDAARFEVPAHRWIDLSEADYGVSLLNDCKYGFDVHDNVMRISLLRAPTHPDPNCDEGVHDMTYSLYPHAGSWQEAATVRRGYELNVPLVTTVADVRGTKSSFPNGFASVDLENVVIDCIKKAEDTDDVIVRLYEAHGARGAGILTFRRSPVHVSECDLMEENDAPVEVDGGTVSFRILPWEIRTFKVRF